MPVEEIRAILIAKADALIGRSARALGRLIDPGFVYMNAAGRIFDKTGYVDAYCTSGRIVFRRQGIADLRVSVFPGFTVATMLVDDAFEVDGETVERQFRSLGVFRNVDGLWLWAAGQTSRCD